MKYHYRVAKTALKAGKLSTHQFTCNRCGVNIEVDVPTKTLAAEQNTYLELRKLARYLGCTCTDQEMDAGMGEIDWVYGSAT